MYGIILSEEGLAPCPKRSHLMQKNFINWTSKLKMFIWFMDSFHVVIIRYFNQLFNFLWKSHIFSTLWHVHSHGEYALWIKSVKEPLRNLFRHYLINPFKSKAWCPCFMEISQLGLVCHSKCGALKNPHCSMAMSAEDDLKFAAIHR